MAVQPLRRAIVTRVTSVGVYCTIPTIGPNYEIGPMDSGTFSLAPGDRLIVGQAGNEQESWVVMTKLAPIPIAVASTFVYYFETLAARDAVFDGVPAHMVSPTFAWVDDALTLYVWTDETNAWRQVSWDESRVASIESVNTAQGGSIAALQTRATNLEALAVSDTSTIDLTLTGASWPKTISGSVIANSIPLNDLSDVVISSPAVKQVVRHNGTNWVNAQVAMADLSNVTGTPVAGDQLTYSGSNWVNDPVGTEYGFITGGIAAASNTTEVAVATSAWVHEPSLNFVNGKLYKFMVQWQLGIQSAGASAMYVKFRKGAQTITGQILFQSLQQESSALSYNTRFMTGYVKNVSGANISTALSMTIQRTAGGSDCRIYGDTDTPVIVQIDDIGYASTHKMAAVATSIT